MPHVKARGTPFAWHIRVVDADTNAVLEHVIEADSEERWVRRLEHDDKGRPKLDPAGDSFLISTTTGVNLRIEINEGRLVDKGTDRFVLWNPDEAGIHRFSAAAA